MPADLVGPVVIVVRGGCIEGKLVNLWATMQSLIWEKLPHVHISDTHLELSSLSLDLSVICECERSPLVALVCLDFLMDVIEGKSGLALSLLLNRLDLNYFCENWIGVVSCSN